MGLSIKNDEVEQMARDLARKRKISVTEAIRQSLKRETERENLIPREAKSDLFKKMMEISDRASRIPDVNELTDDEILGYDKNGVPTL